MTLDSIQRFIDKLGEFKDAPDNPADEIDNLDKAQSIQSLEIINKYIAGEIDKPAFKLQLAALLPLQDIRTQSRAQIENILRNCDNE
jgi:hypothetical protein